MTIIIAFIVFGFIYVDKYTCINLNILMSIFTLLILFPGLVSVTIKHSIYFSNVIYLKLLQNADSVRNPTPNAIIFLFLNLTYKSISAITIHHCNPSCNSNKYCINIR